MAYFYQPTLSERLHERVAIIEAQLQSEHRGMALSILLAHNLDESLMEVVTTCTREIGFALDIEGGIDRDSFARIASEEVDINLGSLSKVNQKSGAGICQDEGEGTCIGDMANSVQNSAGDIEKGLNEFFLRLYDGIKNCERFSGVSRLNDLGRF